MYCIREKKRKCKFAITAPDGTSNLFEHYCHLARILRLTTALQHGAMLGATGNNAVSQCGGVSRSYMNSLPLARVSRYSRLSANKGYNEMITEAVNHWPTRPFLFSFLLPSWRAVKSYWRNLEGRDPIWGDDWSHAFINSFLAEVSQAIR